jgi:tetratricopeptide (TPR) repeat protein
VVASEKVGQIDAARAAYAAALARWPESLGASIGLANMQHAERDYGGAERTLSRAVELHPDSVPAWNNLAEAYLMQRRYPEALSAARHAVDLGGPLAPAARATLSEIEARGYKND